ncbi:hypothetical protein EON80_18175 [bacterium]|nr:MAG: hypothetical protein EON80_18175 [bacterium]
MYCQTLERLNALQETRLQPVTRNDDRLVLHCGPPTKIDGVYWLYTTYTDADFRACTPSTKRKSVAINRIATERQGLRMICTREVNGFRLVYNGIGGLGPKGHGGLRERILQEFRGGEGTGSLAICGSSLNDLSRWRYSYVLWSEISHTDSVLYATQGEGIETMWRLQFGWPILSTK